MIRGLLVLPFLFAGALAAEPRLPVPPVPPRVPPLLSAPVPDLDAQGPLDAESRARLTFNTSINRRKVPDPSLGFSPGSRFESEDDRRLLAIPGLRLHVPFP